MKPSIFRDALQVSQERIASLGDDDLNLLMTELLRDHAYRCGSPPGEVRVNTEGKAGDEGCDGWSGTVTVADEWFGLGPTCWQFKAGSAGFPSRLTGEVTKAIPKATLTSGGRFVVVASGSTSGKKGEEDRRKILRDEAAASGIPTANIDVIGSERLATWCNLHPAVAARWAARPSGLWTLADWANAEVHRVPWQASEAVTAELKAQCAAIDFDNGETRHLHIQGLPGVGKTRLALELCKGALWRGSVIYIQQATDVRLLELIDSAAADAGVRLVVVADEVQPEQLSVLRNSIGRADGRIRLITVGHCASPDPTRIPALLVKPLDQSLAREVVKGWYPAMPPEHTDFVVRFADGYVRLLRLAADSVVRNTAIDVRGLLSRAEIRGFLDGMLGLGDRRALHVVAVLGMVGWESEKQVEGKAIAAHLGMDWNDVRVRVEEFHTRLGIAPRGGRYRYISPTPLGIHLAVEAWTAFPDLLRSLPDVLPSEEAKDSYYERLQSIASNLYAAKFAREELGFFFRLSDFTEPRSAQRWSALAAADPDLAARNIFLVLSNQTIESRKTISDSARRAIVWTLVRLAWRSASFADAAKALALLAEAENETWANNATGEFLARFQVFLGGTAVPYIDRLPVIDELLSLGRPVLTRLAIKALARVGEQRASRVQVDPLSDSLPEEEWNPRSGAEHVECLRAAVTRLKSIANAANPDLESDLVVAAKELSMLLRPTSVRPIVAEVFDAIRLAYPNAREPLRRAVAEILNRERKYWNELSAEDVAGLESLHAQFEDQSLGAQLRQHVGLPPWESSGQHDFTGLARELLASPEVLRKEWGWLTSGEAGDGWRFGETLGRVDMDGLLINVLPSLAGAGRDLRVLTGYISVKRKELGDEWYDRWIGEKFRQKGDLELLFEVAWRCGPTNNIARLLIEVLRTGEVDASVVGRLGFGSWGDELAADILRAVLRSMVDAGNASTALTILERRMTNFPSERQHWQELAIELVTTPSLIRGDHMTSYYWKRVALMLLPEFTAEVSAAIVAEQGRRSTETWFAQHSEASEVLAECVQRDAMSVWSAIKDRLTSDVDGHMFTLGFPRQIVDRVPMDVIMSWIGEDPEGRAPMVAKLITLDFSSDVTLAAQVLGNFGDVPEVSSAFFGEYVSGSWWGSASSRWTQLSAAADEVSQRTKLPKVRRWASDAARDLKEMAERDRQNEEERDFRRH